MQKYYGKELKQCTLQNVVGSTTKDWEVLLDGEAFTNGLHSEQECLNEIEGAQGKYKGKWSYREFVQTLSVGKVVEM